MSDVVLDSSAVLALLADEAGSEAVKAALPGALLSTVNLAEIVAKLPERGMPAAAAASLVDATGVDIVHFDAGQAIRSGDLRLSTRSLGLSPGDQACLALARARQLPILTADSAWALLTGFEIRLIRQDGSRSGRRTSRCFLSLCHRVRYQRRHPREAVRDPPRFER